MTQTAVLSPKDEREALVRGAAQQWLELTRLPDIRIEAALVVAARFLAM
jgi:hypothetical protein